MADVKFGFVLNINGQEIALDPRTAAGDLKKPIEVGLPPGTEIRLGKAAGGLQAFADKLVAAFGGTPVPWPQQTDLPTALQGAFGYLTTLEVTINELSITFPAGLGAPPTSYRIGLYVSGSPISIIPKTDVVVFKGFSVLITS